MPAHRGRSLTQDEFAQLLGRAAERHTRADATNFTLPELIEAGAELDIDAETVRAVYAEHERDKDTQEARARAALARSSGARELRPLPHGSRLSFTQDDDGLTLTMPPLPSSKVAAGVVTVLSFGMVGLLAFRIPVALTALGLAIASLASYLGIRSARTTYELRLDRAGGGRLSRFVAGRGKGIPLQAGQLRARLDERVSGNRNAIRRTTYVALDHGTDTHALMEGWGTAEQAWAVERIEHWLRQAAD